MTGGRIIARLLMAGLLAGLLAGCGGPLLSSLGSRLGSGSGPDASPVRIPGSGRVDVRPGDTVYAIAQRYGVNMREIIEINRLTPPYRLQIGESLRLPPPRTYIVVSGDTVFGISRRFGVDRRALVSMNRIAPPYQLRPGQSLRLPGHRQTATTTATSPTVQSASAPPLPQMRGAPAVKAAPAAPAAPARRIAATPPPKSAIPSPPPRASNRFMWPIKGRVVSNFGPREGGLHNDGINIAAPTGSPVKAAGNGVVAYAGDGLKGFGNLLLVKHADGWTTAYAHATRLLVKRGERVARGQVIATIGSSGGVTRPQLHFEIRRGGRAVDPRSWLGS